MKKIMTKVNRILISLLFGLVYILSPLNTSLMVTKAESSGVSFAGFNEEMYSTLPSDLSTIDAVLTDGVLSFTSSNGSAIEYIDLQSIASSVDFGHLELSFSTQAFIAAENGYDTDEASFHLIFTSEESLESPLKTYSVDRSIDLPGSFEALTGNVIIPEGTRFIFIEYSANGYGVNSVQFKSTSLRIKDNEDPVVTAMYNQTWTNAPVSVLVLAQDSQSGIEGIYNADTGEKITGDGMTSFVAVTNEARRFYAVDYSGRTSPTFEASITNIDLQAPLSAPVLAPSSTAWTKSPITVTIADFLPAAGESPERRQYQIDSGSWTDYTGGFTIATEGQHTINARFIDAAGNISPITSRTYQLDQSAPVITALSAYADPNGGASVTFTVSDAYSGGVIRKYTSGIKDKAFFRTSGTLLTQNTFNVALGGTYTVYAADALGNDVIETITIDTFPFIEAIADRVVAEDSVTEISFIVSDSETALDLLDVSIASSDPSILPNPQWLIIGNTLVMTLQPKANQSGGPVTLTVTVRDGSNNVTTKTFKVTVTPVNDAPTAVDDVLETDEDHAVTFNPLLNDHDPENDVLMIQSVSQGVYGSFTLSSDGKTITYTPFKDCHETETAIIEVTDGTSVSRSKVTITVVSQNDRPTAVNDSYIINEDTITIFDVVSNDTDPDLGNTLDEHLTIAEVSEPLHGMITIIDNKIQYVPQTNWSGKDVFTYTIIDGSGILSVASINVYVRTVNDAPTLSGLTDTITILEDSASTTVHFSISDVETNVSSLMVQVASQNENLIPTRSLVLYGVGSTDGQIDFTFDVASQKSGFATLTIRVSDGFSVTTKQIQVVIQAVNDDPFTRPDIIKYVEDQELIIDPAYLLANDSDIDLDTLSFVDFLPIEGQGSLYMLENGKWSFRPHSDSNQDVVLTYVVSDGTTTSTGTLTLKAVAQNDLPIIKSATDNPIEIDEDTQAEFRFDLSDFESLTSDLSITVRSDRSDLFPSTSIKTLLVGNTLIVTLTPVRNQIGSAALTLDVSDGSGVSTLIFPITVNAVNDAPIVADDDFYVEAGTTRLLDVLANDIDVENDALSIISATLPDHGLVTIVDGRVYYTASAGYRGLDRFTVTVSDGLDTSVSTVTLSVGGLFFAPVITPVRALAIAEDTKSPEILFRITDRDQDVLQINVFSTVSALIANDESHLILSDKGNGYYGLSLVPNSNMSGALEIRVTANDGLNTTIMSFGVTVIPVEDTPVAVLDLVRTDEDTSIAFFPTTNDLDPDTPDEMLQLLSITQPLHGSIRMVNGIPTYIPAPDYYGTDSATYSATDGITTVTGSITFEVSPINDAPTTSTWYLELTNAMDQSLVLNALQGVYDVDGDPLTVEITRFPLYGNLSLNASNQVVYTRTQVSPLNNGADRFTLVYRDPNGLSVERDFVIGIDFPAVFWAANVYESIIEDSAGIDINLPISNPDGNPLLFHISEPTKGQVALDSSTGHLTYVPSADKNGNEVLTYTVTDLVTLATITRNVTISINPINDAPTLTADHDRLVWNEDTMSDLLTLRMTDVDGDALTYRFSIVSGDHIVILSSGIQSVFENDTLSLRLSPLQDAYGSSTLRIWVSDGSASTRIDIPLMITAVNDAPQVVDSDQVINEDSAINVDLITSLNDVEEDPLTLVIDQGPSHGVLTLLESGEVRYQPDTNFNGIDLFRYHLNDGQTDSGSATVTIQVLPQNDAPILSELPSLVILNEDGTISFSFSVYDTDGDDLELSVSEYVSDLFDAQDIQIVRNADTVTITLTPNPDQFGSIHMNVSVSDGQSSCFRVVEVLVLPVNDAPIANDDEVTILEDTVVGVDVLLNDHDPENSALRVISVSASEHGATISVDPNGTINIVPLSDWYGDEVIDVTISDAQGGQSTSRLTLHVQPVNDAPVAIDDVVTLNEDVLTIINILGNDADTENDPLTVSIASLPDHGTVTVNSDMTITYHPDQDYFGSDEFTYSITDGNSSQTATVRLTIEAQNDTPIITNKVTQDDGIWIMTEDTDQTFSFLLNDPETDVRNLILTLDSSDQNLIPNTSIRYEGTWNEKFITLVPNEHQNGSLVLTITASDGVNTTVYDIQVQILAVNDAPQLSDPFLSMNEDETLNGKLEASDVDSAILTYSLTTIPAHGSVSLAADGEFSYVPSADYNGEDLFVVTVDDGSMTDTATHEITVHVNIEPVNDAPVAHSVTGNTLEDTPVDLQVDLTDDQDLNPLLNADPDLERLTIDPDGFAGALHGTVTVNGSTLTYVPEANYHGVVSFTYTIVDALGVPSKAEITLVVSGVNDAPSNGDDTLTVIEDTPKELSVLLNDDVDLLTDPLTEHLTILLLETQPIHGNASITADGQRIAYIPDLNYNGPDSFTYVAQDAQGETQTFTVNLTVTPVNDAPTITILPNQTLAEDTPSEVLHFTVNDIEDGGSVTVTASSNNGTLVPNNNSSLVLAETSGTDRTIRIVPAANRNGTVRITLTVRDKNNATSSMSFNVVVTAVNDLPSPVNDSAVTDENTDKIIDVLANDDVDELYEGDDLRLVSIVDADGVSVAGAWSTAIVYNAITTRDTLKFIPDRQWKSKVAVVEVLRYTMVDASGSQEYSGLVSITINPVNDAPIITAILDQRFDEDDPDGFGTVIFQISDEEDGYSLLSVSATSTVSSLISDEAIVISPLTSSDQTDRSLSVTSNADQNGTTQITVTVKDTEGLRSSTSFDVTVNPVDDAPRNGADFYTVTEDTPLTLDVLANDDIDLHTNAALESLIIESIDSQPAHGTVLLAEDHKTIRYIPDENYYGPDQFTYTMNSLLGIPGTFIVDLSVTPVNDAPMIVTDISDKTVDEGQSSGPIQFNLLDVDNMLSDLTVTVNSTNKVLVPLANITMVTLPDGNRQISLMPNGRWNGTTTIELIVRDPLGATSVKKTFKFVVNSINEAPTANADLNTVINEDGSALINVLSNDTDPDLLTNPVGTEVLSVINVSTPAHGAVLIVGTMIRYTPIANYNGTDTFTYTISDASGLTSTALVKVKINGRNDAPTVTGDSTVTDEDQSVIVDVLANDRDIDADFTLNNDVNLDPSSELLSLDAFGFGNVTHGSVLITADGKIQFIPEPNYNGTVTFSYTAMDQSGAKTIGWVTVSIRAVNDRPVAEDDAVMIKEDDVLTLDLSSSVLDVDMDPLKNAIPQTDLTYELIDLPSHGSASLMGSELTYVPAENDNRPVSLTYRVTDPDGLSYTATVSISIQAVNDAPVSANDDVVVSEDQSILIDVGLNDDDVDLDPTINVMPSSMFFVSEVSLANHGTVSVIAGTTIRYVPNANYNGPDVFTYTILDEEGLMSTATVYVTVLSVNDAPSAISDTVTGNEDSSSTTNVLANDTDIDLDSVLNQDPNQSEHLTLVSVNGVTHGSVSFLATGQITFVPEENFNGIVILTYTMQDDSLVQRSSTLTITIKAVNDAPTAMNDAVTTDEDSIVLIDALSNDADIDLDTNLNHPVTDTLSLVSVSSVTHGTASVVSGKIRFVPAANFNGTATLSYRMKDAAGIQSMATVTITILPKEDAPVAVADSATTTEDQSILIDVLGNDTDVDHSLTLNTHPLSDPNGQSLSIIGIGTVPHGSAIIEANQLRFVPDANYNGTVTFQVTIVDNTGRTSMATVSILITAVNDVPTAFDDNGSMDEDTTRDFIVLANDTDVDLQSATNTLDPQSLQVRVVSVTNGTALVFNNQIRVSSRTDFNGTVTVVYEAYDQHNASSKATLTIAVGQVNDAPVAQDDQVSVDEDGSITFNPLLNDTDIDQNNELNASPYLESLTVLNCSNALSGTVICASDSVTYIPKPNHNGVDRFQVTIIDESGAIHTSDVFVTIHPTNDSPVAHDDVAIVDEDASILIDILANDEDPDLDTLLNVDPSEVLSVIDGSWKNPDHGILVLEGNKLRFTPEPDFNGVVSVTVDITDRFGATSAAVLTITVNPVNDDPQANDDRWEAQEGDNAIIDVLSNDYDVDFVEALNHPLDETWSVDLVNADERLHATVSGNELVVQPETDLNGEFIIIYQITDKHGASDQAKVVISLNAVNDAPQAQEDVVWTDEDQSITLDVLANDVDADLDPRLNLASVSEALTLSAVSSASLGIVAIHENKLVYTPFDNVNGTEVLTYTVTDKTGIASITTVTIHIRPINDTPVAQADIAMTDEDMALEVNVLSNDVDPDALPELNASPSDLVLILGSVQQVDHATIIIRENKVLIVPEPDFNGQLNIPYTVRDVSGAESSAMLTLIVRPVNDAPIAGDDEVFAHEDEAILIDVLANDFDVDKEGWLNQEPLDEVLSIGSDPRVDHGGSVTVFDGKIRFVPNPDVNGDLIVTYTVFDASGATDTGTILIHVAAINDSPIANDDYQSTKEDTPILIDVLDNDADIDAYCPISQNCDLSDRILSEIDVPVVENAVITVVDQQLYVVPMKDFNGTLRFTYLTHDASGAYASASVIVTVEPQPDAPIAQDDYYTIREDDTVIFDVLENDHDVDRDPELNLEPWRDSIIVNPTGFMNQSHGIVTVLDGKVQFVPEPNFNGEAGFDYTIIDASGMTSMAHVTVTINKAPDSPVAESDSVSVYEDGSVTIDVLSNDHDIDFDPSINLEPDQINLRLVPEALVNPRHGSIRIVDQKVIYVPLKDYNGPDSFTYTICDADGNMAQAIVTLTVDPVNDVPTAIDDQYSLREDESMLLDVLVNDLDVDMNSELNLGQSTEHLSVKDALTDPVGAHLEIVDGKILFFPTRDYNGWVEFDYEVVDEAGAIASAHVKVQVFASNDVPTAVDDEYVMDEDTSLIVNPLFNDNDIDLDLLLNHDVITDGLSIVSIESMDLHGTLTLTQEGYQYVPDADFNGDVLLTVTISDRSGSESKSTMIIHVLPVNDPVKAIDDEILINEDSKAVKDIIANDIDNDLDREGDTLTITSIDQPIHGRIIVLDDGHTISYQPAPNYHGIEDVFYTVSDQSGLSSTGKVRFIVLSRNDTPAGLIVLTPGPSEAYKDGQTVHVSWSAAEDLDQDPIVYRLEFYDGSTWVVLAVDLKTLTYEHVLQTKITETDQAQYRVTASDGSTTISASSEHFVIDNRAPRDVTLALSCLDGKDPKDGVCQNGINLKATQGTDLLDFVIEYRIVGSTDWQTLSSEGLRFDRDGHYTVEIRATDLLGNQQILSTVLIVDHGSPLASLRGFGLLIGLMLLLLLIFGRRQVTIIFRGRNAQDQSFVQKHKKFAVRPRKEKPLMLNLPQCPPNTTDIELIYSKAFTRSMRKQETVVLLNGKELGTFVIPEDQTGSHHSDWKISE